MPVGVTAVSRQIYDLHMTIFWICVAIGVVVFGAMLISMILHRKSRGHEPANFHENLALEISWTLVPFIILIAMAIPATRTLITIYDFGGEDLHIEVRGYQWKWQYKYLDENLQEQVSFFSNLSTPRDEVYNRTNKGDNYLLEVDNPLVIPANRKVRFLLTSNDVIHAWWVPDFGIKRDAIPGFINELWTLVEEPGVYRGQCTELCGKDHGFMPIVVRVLPEAEFDAWYASQLSGEPMMPAAVDAPPAEAPLVSDNMDSMDSMTAGLVSIAAAAEPQEPMMMQVQAGTAAGANEQWDAARLMAEGEGVYSTHCVACHQPSGAGIPPAFPTLIASPVVTGNADELLQLVYYGRPGTAMQAFGQQLPVAKVAAVSHYIRNAFGNSVEGIILPADLQVLVDQQSQ